MTQLLKRWEEHTFHLLGQPIQLKVKAPHFADEGEFNRNLMGWGRKATKAREAIKAAQEGGVELSTEATDELFQSIDPKWALSVFEKNIRLVEPIKLEDEPEAGPIETSAQLFDIANQALVMQVLGKVGEMARLGMSEGKASSSPSTSWPAGTSGVGASPATSTESVDGPTP